MCVGVDELEDDEPDPEELKPELVDPLGEADEDDCEVDDSDVFFDNVDLFVCSFIIFVQNNKRIKIIRF